MHKAILMHIDSSSGIRTVTTCLSTFSIQHKAIMKFSNVSLQTAASLYLGPNYIAGVVNQKKILVHKLMFLNLFGMGIM